MKHQPFSAQRIIICLFVTALVFGGSPAFAQDAASVRAEVTGATTLAEQTSYNDFRSWNVMTVDEQYDVVNETAGPLTDDMIGNEEDLRGFSFTITRSLHALYQRIHENVRTVLYLLLSIEFAVVGLMVIMGKNNDIAGLVQKVITIGIQLYIFENLWDLTTAFSMWLNSAVTSIGGDVQLSASDPTAIFTTLWRTFVEMLGNETDVGLLGILRNTSMLFRPSGLLLLVTIGVYAFVGVYIAATVIVNQWEMYLVLTVGAALYPFSMFKHTAWIGEKVISATISQAIQLATVILVGNLIPIALVAFASTPGAGILGEMSFFKVGMLLISSFVAIMLTKRAPALAVSLITGSPDTHSGGAAIGGLVGSAIGATAAIASGGATSALRGAAMAGGAGAAAAGGAGAAAAGAGAGSGGSTMLRTLGGASQMVSTGSRYGGAGMAAGATLAAGYMALKGAGGVVRAVGRSVAGSPTATEGQKESMANKSESEQGEEARTQDRRAAADSDAKDSAYAE